MVHSRLFLSTSQVFETSNWTLSNISIYYGQIINTILIISYTVYHLLLAKYILVEQ